MAVVDNFTVKNPMFVIKRSSIVIISALILTFITLVICIVNLGVKPITNAESYERQKIVLDAGHGGVDGGAVGVKSGVSEAKLNLIVVNRLKTHLENAGFGVVLTRSDENGLYGNETKNRKKKDMQKRKEIIDNANASLVISVHMNTYANSSRRGAQVFYNKNSNESISLANNVQNSFNNMEEAVKKTQALKGDYYLLNYVKTPCIIAECGFLSNPEEEKLLCDEEYLEKIAYAIYKGVIGYMSENTIKFCD